MPADLESCVQQVLQKQPDLDESNAYAICQNAVGKVQQVSRTGQLATFEDNGRYYVKAFLLDASVNINQWGVTTASLKKNINTFVGKPLVLTEDYDHPVPNGADSLEHWLAYQETYRIGTIVDVVAKDTAYYALIEITNEDAKRAFRSGALPTYVSPAIAQDSGDPAAAIDSWSGVHLAIVDDPAYTVKKATINASCGGESIDCLLQLRKAKIAKSGLGCGFCAFKVLTARFSSHGSSGAKFKTGKLSEDNRVTDNKDTSTTAPAGEETVPKSQYEELQKKLADSELKVKELTETNQSISSQVAEIQLERRREKIERIITADIIKDDKRRFDKVNAMTASSIPMSEIEELYKDAVVVRKASVERAQPQARAHVTLGGNEQSQDEERIERGRKLAAAAGMGGVS